jgi:hypothetical protein
MPQTLEGLKDASIMYSFAVEIGRKHGKNITYRKPLRVIRAPKPACVDLVRPFSLSWLLFRSLS